MTNRWFTNTGKRKRVPANFESLKEFAQQHKDAIMKNDMIELTTLMRVRYNLGLAEGLSAAIYFIGMYNNSSTKPRLFTMERFEQGRKLLHG